MDKQDIYTIALYMTVGALILIAFALGRIAALKDAEFILTHCPCVQVGNVGGVINVPLP